MSTKKHENIENILENEGVNAKGYGIISQSVMFDRDLSITSKAIYAYFCSYLGSGRTIFPKTETILSHLKISKNTYYKHFNPLVKNGYIKVSKATGFLNKNIYTLCNNVAKLKDITLSKITSDSLLVIDGINASGYGYIPKLIMTDNRLTIKAKGLVAFLYSLAQGGCQAFPHRATVCSFLNISKDLYYTSLNQLIECNYITTKQRHVDNGRFSVTDFILNSKPKQQINKPLLCPDFCDNEDNGLNSETSPCPEICDNGKNGLNTKVSPCPDFCDNGEHNRVLNFGTLPCRKNCDNNNNTRNNNISYISSSNQQVEMIPYVEDIDEIRNLIYEFTWYDNYSIHNYNKDNIERDFCKQYRKTVNCLIDMLSENKVQKYGKDIVSKKQLFNNLNECFEKDTYDYSLRDLIFTIIQNFNIVQERYVIKHPYEYLKSLIWDNIKNYGLKV